MVDNAVKVPAAVKAWQANDVPIKAVAKARPAKNGAKKLKAKNGAKKAKVKGKKASKKINAAKKPASKKAAKKARVGKKKAGWRALGSLDRKAASVYSELMLARSAFEKSEALMSKKIAEKAGLEAELNSLLRKNFAAEKAILASIKKDSAKREAGLRTQIASLEKVTKVYEEKKARIDQARKKQAALKKQLMLLEQQAGA